MAHCGADVANAGIAPTIEVFMREESLPEIIDLIKSIEKLSNGHLGNARWALECANSLWQRAPFQVDDRVKLNTTPEISAEKSWGWMGAKHFLIEGALATVHHREFYDGQFVFGLAFDDESWINHDGIKHMRKPESI